jgi:predicted DNA-binding protein
MSDETTVARAPASLEAAVDESLGLKSISIRLQSNLLERLKLIAEVRGIGYQPLVREVLNEFTRNELLRLARIDADYNKAISKAIRSRP